MLPTKSGRSYSEFFTSGFRAMTTRSLRRNSAMTSPSPTENDPPSEPTTPKSSRRHSKLFDFAKRHSRPTSMILPPSTSFRTTSSSLSTQPSERHKRRSSIISFSNRLFDRKSATALDNSLSFSSSPSKNTRELLNSTDILEVWITAGGPYTIKSYEDSIVLQSIDPFASSPESKSFFSDWTESPAPSNRSSKGQRDSFLSLSGSSSDRSFLHLPSLRRRERPTSVQTAPLPNTSRRSSYIAFPPNRDSWVLGEEILEEEYGMNYWQGSGHIVEDILEEQPGMDPAQNIDWRQFHLDILPHET